VVVFYLAFWLLGAIINRGRWGHWVIFGLLVGAASYGGHLLGQLFQAPFWQLTARQGQEVVQGQLLAPLAIVAFVVGRELTIWFGAWVAARSPHERTQPRGAARIRAHARGGPADPAGLSIRRRPMSLPEEPGAEPAASVRRWPSCSRRSASSRCWSPGSGS
jgi:hypothetical protein